MKIISQSTLLLKEYTIVHKKVHYRYTEWIEEDGLKKLDASLCHADGSDHSESEEDLLEKFSNFVEKTLTSNKKPISLSIVK